jgi:misacylated tRNA(Ala) deacylase
MTERLFLAESNLASAPATVQVAGADGIILDRSIFYARSGGQPGDVGTLRWEDGEVAIVDTVKGESETILHLPATGSALPPIGGRVEMVLDWPRRHALMRMHTTLHLLCAALPGAAVTGGQIGADRSRLDFDLPEAPDRTALEARLNALIAEDYAVSAHWVDESVLDENPALVRTLSVKPPRGTGRLRLVQIGGDDAILDLQPCGGTHVSHTNEIGAVKIVKVENKGRQNRRIVVALG